MFEFFWFYTSEKEYVKLTIAELMLLPRGVYITKTPDGDDAALKVSVKDPVLSFGVPDDNFKVHYFEYYSDGTVRERIEHLSYLEKIITEYEIGTHK